MTFHGILAILGPWLLGFALTWRELRSWDVQTRLFACSGLGFFLGFGLAGLSSMIFIWLEWIPLPGFLVWLPLAAACGILLFPTRHSRIGRNEAGNQGGNLGASWLLTGFLLAYGLVFLSNAVIPPVLGWDTWQSWLPRPTVWFHLGEAVQFVSSKEWLASEGINYRLRDPADPNLIPSLMLWSGGFSGTWDPKNALALWPMAWIATACLLAATARAFGCGSSVAISSAAFFALTPFPMMHAAIPGYADIWVAGFLLSAIAWLKIARDGSRAAMIFLGLSALALLLAKDGMVFWLVMLVLAWLGTLVGATWWRVLSLTAVAVVILSISLMALGPDLGTSWPFAIGYEEDSVPRIFHFMFLTGDWSLIFWLLPVALAWTWIYPDRCSTELKFLASFTVVALSCLWVIFTCTPRAEGAVTGEIINRALLHGVPASLLMMAVVVERIRADRPGRLSNGR